MQCLFHLPHFNDYFVSQKYKSENNARDKDVIDIYRSLYIDVMQNK
jgi:putative ubiquitin-RnfH superfamily antitoxin RatB of RatAB toxin-antitoxin module